LDWIITTGAPWTQNQMEDSNFMKSWKLIIQKKKKIYIYKKKKKKKIKKKKKQKKKK